METNGWVNGEIRNAARLRGLKIFDCILLGFRLWDEGAIALSRNMNLAEVAIISSGTVVGIGPSRNLVVREAAGREGWLDLLTYELGTETPVDSTKDNSPKLSL